MTDYIIVENKKIEIVQYGPAPSQAPTLVFLHEGLGCARLWKDFPEKLAGETGCGGLVYSRLGYGGSDPCDLPRPVDFMHQEALTILPKVLKKTGVREYLLIGHSDGGSIVLIFAGGTSAAGLKGIITEAAHVFCEDKTVAAIKQAKTAYDYGSLKKKLAGYHGSNTECAFRGWNNVWLHPAFATWNIEAYLPAIKVPMLVIQGKNDQYGTVEQVKAISRNISAPSEVYMVPNCGHAPHREKKDAVLKKMTDFVLSLL